MRKLNLYVGFQVMWMLILVNIFIGAISQQTQIKVRK